MKHELVSNKTSHEESIYISKVMIP